MKLSDLRIYEIAMSLGEEVYEILIQWDYFNKDSLGKQWIRAIDSVALNISEGFGRYSYKDQCNFYYFSRGSLHESYTCLKKAKNRNLVDDEKFNFLLKEHEELTIKINKFIKTINELINKNNSKNN